MVIVVTDRQTDRQTDKPTPVKTHSLAFAAIIIMMVDSIIMPLLVLKSLMVDVNAQLMMTTMTNTAAYHVTVILLPVTSHTGTCH